MKQSTFNKNAATSSSETSTNSKPKRINAMPNSLVGKTLTEELLSVELLRIDAELKSLSKQLGAIDAKKESEVSGDEVDELAAYMKENETIKAKEMVITNTFFCLKCLHVSLSLALSSRSYF
jgi:hypothetical protein